MRSIDHVRGRQPPEPSSHRRTIRGVRLTERAGALLDRRLLTPSRQPPDAGHSRRMLFMLVSAVVVAAVRLFGDPGWVLVVVLGCALMIAVGVASATPAIEPG